MPHLPRSVRVVDSHTEGEPTRVVVEGGPELGIGPLSERVERFRSEYDAFRSGVVLEPRGSDAMVGALLVPPEDPLASAGVIFFNDVGYLGMCGHGTIGLMVTLAYLERLSPGAHRIETPVGTVDATLHEDGRVTVRNVPAYRHLKGITVELGGLGAFTGDVAWGGNWFFLVENAPVPIVPEAIPRLSVLGQMLRNALRTRGITGANGEEIDHIEFFGAPLDPLNDSRNFVLCPGVAYDRSPCGTGTSAKLACLAADGKLAPGAVWRQESIIGSVFEATYHSLGERVLPSITGRAYVTADSTLYFQASDPFRAGIPRAGNP